MCLCLCLCLCIRCACALVLVSQLRLTIIFKSESSISSSGSLVKLSTIKLTPYPKRPPRICISSPVSLLSCQVPVESKSASLKSLVLLTVSRMPVRSLPPSQPSPAHIRTPHRQERLVPSSPSPDDEHRAQRRHLADLGRRSEGAKELGIWFIWLLATIERPGAIRTHLAGRGSGSRSGHKPVEPGRNFASQHRIWLPYLFKFAPCVPRTSHSDEGEQENRTSRLQHHYKSLDTSYSYFAGENQTTGSPWLPVRKRRLRLRM